MYNAYFLICVVFKLASCSSIGIISDAQSDVETPSNQITRAENDSLFPRSKFGRSFFDFHGSFFDSRKTHMIAKRFNKLSAADSEELDLIFEQIGVLSGVELPKDSSTSHRAEDVNKKSPSKKTTMNQQGNKDQKDCVDKLGLIGADNFFINVLVLLTESLPYLAEEKVSKLSLVIDADSFSRKDFCDKVEEEARLSFSEQASGKFFPKLLIQGTDETGGYEQTELAVLRAALGNDGLGGESFSKSFSASVCLLWFEDIFSNKMFELAKEKNLLNKNFKTKQELFPVRHSVDFLRKLTDEVCELALKNATDSKRVNSCFFHIGFLFHHFGSDEVKRLKVLQDASEASFFLDMADYKLFDMMSSFFASPDDYAKILGLLYMTGVLTVAEFVQESGFYSIPAGLHISLIRFTKENEAFFKLSETHTSSLLRMARSFTTAQTMSYLRVAYEKWPLTTAQTVSCLRTVCEKWPLSTSPTISRLRTASEKWPLSASQTLSCLKMVRENWPYTARETMSLFCGSVGSVAAVPILHYVNSYFESDTPSQ